LQAPAAPITYDFRSTAEGGNVGDAFDGLLSASAAVSGVTINGIVTEPNLVPREFNFNNGSDDLGMGVNSDADARPTQIEVGEAVSFSFDQLVRVREVTLQVFFLTASDGVGGPVAQENDEIDITIAGSTVTVASPVNFDPSMPSTYTIDISSQGFPSTLLNLGQTLELAPSRGDGVRLFSITVEQVPEPGPLALAGMAACGLAAVMLRRRLG
jgi:hypothetical protein